MIAHVNTHLSLPKAQQRLELQNRRREKEVAERKRAEEDLRKSEERFTLAMQGANDGLWDWDMETDVIYYSPP